MKNKYEIRGDCIAVYVKSKGVIMESLFDKDDLELLIRYNATFGITQSKGKPPYVSFLMNMGNGIFKHKKVHRLLMGEPKGKYVDHINHNTLDNRRSNLRIVTPKENNQNRFAKRTSKTGVRGVHFEKKGGKYVATVGVNGKIKYLGVFDEIEHAKRAAEEARAVVQSGSLERLRNIKYTGFAEKNRVKLGKRPNKNNKLSGVRNIYWLKRERKWRVSFVIKGKTKTVGEYADFEEAKQKAEFYRNNKHLL